MPKHIKAFAPLIALSLLGLLFALGLRKDPSKLPSELIDRPFPEFRLTAMNDESRVLTQELLRGDIRLVNVFGSWCVACEYEHEKLMKISRKGGIDIIGVNWRDSREKGSRWLERRGNPYSEIIFDPDSVLAVDLGVTGAPETFIVDKAGNIRFKFTGAITDDIWTDAFKPRIKALRSAP